MRTTIDKAGRVVIPLAIRQKAMLEPGTEVEIEVDDRGVRLARAVPGPELVRENGRLIARPTAPKASLPKVDISQWIDDERERWP
jgi:AbrB family looped-hinge helix DNA binding protein